MGIISTTLTKRWSRIYNTTSIFQWADNPQPDSGRPVSVPAYFWKPVLGLFPFQFLGLEGSLGAILFTDFRFAGRSFLLYLRFYLIKLSRKILLTERSFSSVIFMPPRWSFLYPGDAFCRSRFIVCCSGWRWLFLHHAVFMYFRNEQERGKAFTGNTNQATSPRHCSQTQHNNACCQLVRQADKLVSTTAERIPASITFLVLNSPLKSTRIQFSEISAVMYGRCYCSYYLTAAASRIQPIIQKGPPAPALHFRLASFNDR